MRLPLFIIFTSISHVGLAVELMVSVLQSPHQTRHPAPSHLPVDHHHTDSKNGSSSGNISSSGGGGIQQQQEKEKEVTPIPHQIRGSLHKFTQMDITVSYYCMIISHTIYIYIYCNIIL